MPKISVRFYLSQAKKKSTNVMSSINYNKVRIRVSTGLTIETKYWNPKDQRVKSNSPFAIHQNKILTDYSSKVIDSVYTLINSGRSVTKYDLLQISAEHSKTDKNSVNRNGLTLVNAMLECINHKKKEGVKDRTLSTYSKFVNIVREYENTKKIKLLVKDINYQMFSKFIHDYLIGERGVTNGTATSYYTILKTTVSYLKKHKNLKISDSYRDVKIVKRKDPPKRLSVTATEFKKIYNHSPAMEEDILHYKYKLLVRDRFLISVLTGLRFSDISQIDGNNLIETDSDGNKWIQIYDRKTSFRNDILLDATIDEILARNNYNLKGEGKNDINIHNRVIKTLFKEIGIDRPFKSDRRSGNEITDVIKPAYEFATSHTGRRTTATLLRGWDVVDSKIVQITNHRDKSILGTYDQNDQKKIRLEISKLFAEKLGLQKMNS